MLNFKGMIKTNKDKEIDPWKPFESFKITQILGGKKSQINSDIQL